MLMCTGSSIVPNLQVEPWFDDGRTVWKWQVYCVARTTESAGEVRLSYAVEGTAIPYYIRHILFVVVLTPTRVDQ